MICFVITIFIFRSEYIKLGKNKEDEESILESNLSFDYKNTKFDKVITISREYGSGGRYVAQLLAKKLNIPCYDREIIRLTAKESGFTRDFVEQADENKNSFYENDDRMFIAEAKVIKKLAKKSCVIVGRCADYILRDNKNIIKVFLYSDVSSKEKRAIKYYNLDKKNALEQINIINRDRAKHYKYYTEHDWKSLDNYDMMLNVDKYGVEKTAENIADMLR